MATPTSGGGPSGPPSNVNIPAQSSSPGSPPVPNPRPPGAPPPVALPVELWRSILLLQLSECWNDVRSVDNLVWQIPTGIGAILGLVLTAIAPRISLRPSLFEVLAVSGASMVTMSLIVALYKNREFQKSRSRYIKAIHMQLLRTNGASARAKIPAELSPVDHDIRDLPGLVAFSTRDLNQLRGIGGAPGDELAGVRAKFRNVRAFRVLICVSVGVCCGEVALAIWLLARLVAGS